MFDLKKHASPDLKKAVKAAYGITRGKFQPFDLQAQGSWEGSELDDPRIAARVYNRRYPNGVTVTEGMLVYASMYL